VDRYQLWHRSSVVAVVQSETEGGAASGRQSAVRTMMEAVGNFVLVFVFGIAIAIHSWFAPLLIGAALVAMVYSRTRALVAYYNPALTLAMLMRRQIGVRDAIAFCLIQSGAGLLAAIAVRMFVDPRKLAVTAATVTGYTLVAALALELVVTCALCSVALDVSTSNVGTADEYNRMPFAFSFAAAVITIGIVTNGALNPDIGFGGAMREFFSWPTLCIYLVAQLLSGIAATITFMSLADHR
jgi:aquaporin Z